MVSRVALLSRLTASMVSASCSEVHACKTACPTAGTNREETTPAACHNQSFIPLLVLVGKEESEICCDTDPTQSWACTGILGTLFKD